MAKKTRDWTVLTKGRADELKRELASQGCPADWLRRDAGNCHSSADAAPENGAHAACYLTYEPTVIVVAQGRKEVQAGATTLTYDSSRYLLASVDLPTVTRVSVASEDAPCLAVSLKLDISIVREIVSREEFRRDDAAKAGPALFTGPVTPEFLSGWCRLLDLLSTPEDIPFLSGLIEREILYRILSGPEGARLRAIATLGDQSHRTAKAIAWVKGHYDRPLRVKELAEVADMAVTTLHHHFRALTGMSPLQYQKQIRLTDRASADDCRRCRRGDGRLRCGLRKRESIQP